MQLSHSTGAEPWKKKNKTTSFDFLVEHNKWS